MAAKKKLQVFVSSTFEDLKAERQAAVEAILTAGHIPAGMELFTAGDQSQMNVIKRWIDESDVYLLILGFRYGSIEPESQKSYTHLEYEYALEKGKALFAVVVNESCREDRVKALGSKIIEQENSQKLRDFRSLVETKMIRRWSDTKDIKIAVMETMHEFSLREELIGWIPGSEAIDGGMLAEEMARLTKENERLSLITNSDTKTTYSGLTFDEMLNLLVQEDARALSNQPDELMGLFYTILEAIVQRLPSHLANDKPNMLPIFIALVATMDISDHTINVDEPQKLYFVKELMNKFGLFSVTERDLWDNDDAPLATYKLTEDGLKFSLKLKAKGLW